MGHPDDYRDEMERLTSQDADDLLSGGVPRTAAATVAAAAVERVREELLVAPSPETSRRHLAAMRIAAGSDSLDARGDEMRKRAKKRAATVALAATLILGAGIAAALTLPEQAADRAKERVAGVQLPEDAKGPGNGRAGASAQTASDHGKAVSEAARDDSTTGCEKGRAVSEIASSKADEHRKNPPKESDPCTANEGSNAGGQGKSNAGGQGKSNAGGQGKSNAGGQGKSNAGGQGKNELPHGPGVESNNGRGSGGPPETRGASGDHAKSAE